MKEKNYQLNIRAVFTALLLIVSAFAMTACEKSRLKVRPAVATTPKSGVNTHQPADDQHHDDHSGQPTSELDPPEQDVDHEEGTRSESRRDNTEGVPRVVVNPNQTSNRKATDVKRGTELGCKSHNCDPDLPETDIPDRKPEPIKDTTHAPVVSEPVVNEPIIISEPIVNQPIEDDIIIDQPNQSETIQVLNYDRKDLNHFNIALVVDPNSIKENSAKYEGSEANRKKVVTDIVESFIEGIKSYRNKLSIDSKQAYFNLGVIAATKNKSTGIIVLENQYSTENYFDLKVELHIALERIAKEETLGDGDLQITGGHPYIALTNAIETNERFFSGVKPTTVFIISDTKDNCQSDDNLVISDKCDDRHNFKSIYESMFAQKVNPINQLKILSPLSFKYILLNHNREGVEVFTSLEESKKGSTTKKYSGFHHGEAFGFNSQGMKHVFELEKDLSHQTVVLRADGVADDTCVIYKDRIFTGKRASILDISILNLNASAKPKYKFPVCKHANSLDNFNDQITDYFYKNNF